MIIALAGFGNAAVGAAVTATKRWCPTPANRAAPRGGRHVSDPAARWAS